MNISMNKLCPYVEMQYHFFLERSSSTNYPIAMHLREHRCAHEAVICAYVIMITDWSISGPIRIKRAKISLFWLVSQMLFYLQIKFPNVFFIVWNCVVDVVTIYRLSLCRSREMRSLHASLSWQRMRARMSRKHGSKTNIDYKARLEYKLYLVCMCLLNLG